MCSPVMLETSTIHSSLQSFYAQKPTPVVFPDDSDDEGNPVTERACEADPTTMVAYMRAPAVRVVTAGDPALAPVVFPEDSDDDAEIVQMFVHSDSDNDDVGTA